MAVVHDALGEVDHGAVAAGGEERVEETLGPIAPVATFSTTAQAVADANVTEYGLASYLYAATPDDGRAFAAHLGAGMVGIGTGLDVGFSVAASLREPEQQPLRPTVEVLGGGGGLAAVRRELCIHHHRGDDTRAAQQPSDPWPPTLLVVAATRSVGRPRSAYR